MKRLISFFLSSFFLVVFCGSVFAAVPPDVVISVPGVAPGYITGVIDFNYFSGSPLVASTYSTPWSDILVNGSYAGSLRYNYQGANDYVYAGRLVYKPTAYVGAPVDTFVWVLPIYPDTYFFRAGHLYSFIADYGYNASSISVSGVDMTTVWSSGKTVFFVPASDVDAFDLRFTYKYNSGQKNVDMNFNAFSVACYGSAAENSDLIGAIENNTQQITGAIQGQTQHQDEGYQAGVDPEQGKVNSDISAGVADMDSFEDGVYADINDYKSGLDFGFDDFAEAGAGLGYIKDVFMMIWDNSPVQPIILSLMMGVALLLLGRGVSAATSTARENYQADRRAERRRLDRERSGR